VATDPRFLSAGDRAWLIEPGGAGSPTAIAAALRRARIPGVEDILPAAETVLVTVHSPAAADRVRGAARELLRDLAASPSAAAHQDGRHPAVPDATAAAPAAADVSRGTPPLAAPAPDEDPVIVCVHYDGEDLDRVAGLLGIDVPTVIARHTGALWRCEFAGFAPGFGYLRTADTDLTVPRRDRARTSVPAGAVALAGGYSAVYPRSSPGGWQLIGHTDAVLWDERRDPPALIRAGATVRFVDAGRTARDRSAPRREDARGDRGAGGDGDPGREETGR